MTSTDSGTWSLWNNSSDYTNIVSVSSSATDGVWQLWNGNDSTTASSNILNATTSPTDSNTVWVTWNNPVTLSPSPSMGNLYGNVESDSDRAAREALFEERRKKKELANIEAGSLLDSILSDIQRESFKKEDWFLVMGKSGNIYRIRRGRIGNVDLISPEGKVLQSYCIHVDHDFPVADNLVAQKLHLEADDVELISRANARRSPDEGNIIDISKYLKKVA